LTGYWENLFLRRGKTHERHDLVKLASQIDFSLSVDFPDSPDHRVTSQWSTVRLAIIYEWFGDWSRAFELYTELVKLNEQLIKLFPDVVSHHYHFAIFQGRQGELAYAMGQHEVAKQHINKSIQKYEEMSHKNQLSPNYMFYYCRLLAEGPFQELRNTQRALELSKQMLDKLPKTAENWLNVGRCLYRNGQFAEAEEAFLNVITTKADAYSILMAHIYLAMTYINMGQLEKAKDAAASTERYVPQFPKDPLMLRLRKEAQELNSSPPYRK
jgi:tetratricopeptide (TPR) repeat protein